MKWYQQFATLKHLGIVIAAFGLGLVAIDRTVEYVAVVEKKETNKIGYKPEESDK